MLSAIMWGVLSTLSFVLFFTLPDGLGGPNYLLLVPGLIALTASIHQLTLTRDQPKRRFGVSAPTAFDDAVIAQTEKVKYDKLEEQHQMLRHQSSRRRAVIELTRQHNEWK